MKALGKMLENVLEGELLIAGETQWQARAARSTGQFEPAAHTGVHGV